MEPPTPAFPKFANNSLLLDTTIDFGADDSLGDLFGPDISSSGDVFASTPLPAKPRLPTSTNRLGRPALSSTSDSPEIARERYEEPLEDGIFVGRGERIAETSASGFARSLPRSASPARSVQRRSDDFYARRISVSRPASPFISTTALPASPLITSSHLARSLSLTRRSSASTSIASFEQSDEEPSRVHFAWRSKPPNAEREAIAQQSSRITGERDVKKTTASGVAKPKPSALGRYLAKAAVLRSEPIGPDRMKGAQTISSHTISSSSSTTSAEAGVMAAPMAVSPTEVAPATEQIVDNALSTVPMNTCTGERDSRTPPRQLSPLLTSADVCDRSPSPHPVRPLSTSTSTSALALASSMRPATPPLLPITETMGSTTTPYGIPMPTLVDLEDDNHGSFNSTEDGDMAHDAMRDGQNKARSRPRSSLVEFFTGFLRGSASRQDTIPKEPEVQAGAHELPVSGGAASTSGAVAEEGRPEAMAQTSNIPAQASMPPMSVQSGHIVPANRPIGRRKPPIPGYIPLTRPSCAKPAHTVASSSRALQPLRTQPSATCNPRPLPTTAEKSPVVGPSKPARKPPLPAFQRPTASSAFAKAALAKLPPPGKGSTAASKPICVRTPERAHDLASRRRVFERPELQTAHNTHQALRTSNAGVSRTIPIVGRTPGKASRARAVAREEYDEALRKRQEEKDAARREEVRRKMEEEEREYQRRRKETVIWAKPVPELYHRGGTGGAE